ncbi:MAG: twin-arginine translocation signal domain-containing protein [Candidatus Hydrogenedens sp.]|nr:twin-arginine translocation signal domain-containing protein [Candidatus Hydrogenedens sp.]
MAHAACTRRGFLKRAALATGALAWPGALNAAAQTMPDVRLGFIGLGARGMELLRSSPALVAGLCDVDASRLADAVKIAGQHVPHTGDYRELLLRADIDAVVIATPDHGHAMQAVHACEAGKYVFLETPLCRTLDESRRIAEAARLYDRRVTPSGAGAGGAAHALAEKLRDWRAEGDPAAVLKVTLTGPESPQGGDPAAMGPAPESFDWDAWLGPASYRPYNPGYSHLNWRWMLDLGGGQMRQQGAWLLAAVFDALGQTTSLMVDISAEGPPPETGLWDCPPQMAARWILEEGAVEIVWQQTSEGRVVLEAEQGERKCRAERTIEGIEWTPDTTASAETLPINPRAELTAWLESLDVKSDDRLSAAALGCDCANLANLAWQLGRGLRFDSRTGRFENDEAAQRMAAEYGRGRYPW